MTERRAYDETNSLRAKRTTWNDLHNMKNRKITVKNKGDQVEVRTITVSGQLRRRRFPSMAQALAHIQRPQNHFVPAFINGYPTIITAWSISNGSGRKALRKPSAQ